MKFSVLIPTRNRLEYLRYAVESVMRQDYADWEIIISDNDSEEDIVGYVHTLEDPRIKYFRTDRFIPVTDNWNAALSKSSGDFVIMLGDDDALMSGYFQAIAELMKDYKNPDFIYTGSFIYAYPRVMPDFPKGNLHRVSNSLFDSAKPYWLGHKRAAKLVRGAMNFRMLYPFNMQHSAINRNFINLLRDKGEFFQSPYPDFYATNVMFLKAKQILIDPRPLVTIGVTAKSYGNFHFNKKEKQGMDFLKHMPNVESVSRLQSIILPGSTNSTSWLLAMESIKENFGMDFNFKVNYKRYRFLQILNIYKNFYFDKRASGDDLTELQSKMHTWEKLVYGKSFWVIFSLLRLFSKSKTDKVILVLRRWIGQYTIANPDEKDLSCKTIIEVFENVNAVKG